MKKAVSRVFHLLSALLGICVVLSSCYVNEPVSSSFESPTESFADLTMKAPSDTISTPAATETQETSTPSSEEPSYEAIFSDAGAYYTFDSPLYNDSVYTKEWFDYLSGLRHYPFVTGYQEEEITLLLNSWKDCHVWEDGFAFTVPMGGYTPIQPVKAEPEDYDAFSWLADEYRQLLTILAQEKIHVWDFRKYGIPQTPDPNGLMLVLELPASGGWTGGTETPALREPLIRLYTIQTAGTAQFLIAEYEGDYTLFAIRSIYEKNYDNGNPCFDASRGILVPGGTDNKNMFILRWQDTAGQERYLWLSCDLYPYEEPLCRPVPQFHHVSMNENMAWDAYYSSSPVGASSKVTVSVSDGVTGWMARGDVQETALSEDRHTDYPPGEGLPVRIYRDDSLQLYRYEFSKEYDAKLFSDFLVVYNGKRLSVTIGHLFDSIGIAGVSVGDYSFLDYRYILRASVVLDTNSFTQGQHFFLGIRENDEGAFTIDWLH